eukprot:1910278-Lingulodinium_polyedra.AAC.1
MPCGGKASGGQPAVLAGDPGCLMDRPVPRAAGEPPRGRSPSSLRLLERRRRRSEGARGIATPLGVG